MFLTSLMDTSFLVSFTPEDLLNSVFVVVFDILYSIWFCLRLYLVLIDLRFLISWFIVINPYFEPLETLWFLTDPIFLYGKKLYPRILGLDATPFINTLALYGIVDRLDVLVNGIDESNYDKIYDSTQLVQPNLDFINTTSLFDFPSFFYLIL